MKATQAMVLFIGMLATAACGAKQGPDGANEQTAETVASSTRSLGANTQSLSLCKAWRWLGVQDPYSQDTLQLADTASAQWLTFSCDGSYHRYTTHQVEQGSWRTNDSLTKLGMWDSPTTSQAELRQKIVRLTADTLVIAWQGRHGWVKDWYSQAKAQSLPSISLQ